MKWDGSGQKFTSTLPEKEDKDLFELYSKEWIGIKFSVYNKYKLKYLHVIDALKRTKPICDHDWLQLVVSFSQHKIFYLLE